MTDPKKKTTTKPKKGLWAAGATVLALGAGAAAFLFARGASASEGGGGGSKSSGKRSGGGGAGGSKSRGSKGPGGDGSSGGRTKPPKPDNERPSDTPEKDGREGYFWGDPDKVPEDFDWSSNQIWVSPDCSTVACGYWVWAEGTGPDGEAARVPMSKLVAAISNDSDQRVRPPRPQFNGVGPEADLLGILSEHPKRTAYTWVGEYYGGVVSAPGHSSTELAEDFMAQASQRTGGFNCMARRDLWSPGMFDFMEFAASRLDQFRRAAYGERAFGG
ncbi:MAG: hypothetical protein ACE37F_14135 [Nannocystaceae bacterium]|nr:hypothetical protein [bacterium]